MLLTAVVDATHPACGESRGWPLEEKRYRSKEVKLRAGMGALEPWEKSRGKSKLAFSNTNRTTEKGTTTKAREKFWQEEGKTSQKAACSKGFETDLSIRREDRMRQRGRRRKYNLARSFQSWQEPMERCLHASTA